MPSTFFKRSTVWVVDFRFDGRPRRWFRAFGPGVDAQAEMQARLRDLYGTHARLVEVRPATPDEETQYLRDEQPMNSLCPTGRRGTPEAPA